MARSKLPVTKTPSAKAAASKSREKRKRPHYEPTFYNQEAENYFNSHLKSREGVRERGITAEFEGILNVVERRGWQKFAEQPEPAVLNVVREFYANARMQYIDDSQSRTVLVRGQDVSYDCEAINNFYGLQNYEKDEYNTWIEEGPDYNEVLDRLTIENSRWKMFNGKPVSFPRGQLRFISRGWHYFISAKLIPSNHVSDVNKDRALLNYAIQSRMTINVGKIIEASIVSCSQGRTSQHLVHPSLIYQLCVKAGVGSTDEEVQNPLPPLNNATMDLFGKATRESRKKKGESPATEDHTIHAEPISMAPPDQEGTAQATPSEGPFPETPTSVQHEDPTHATPAAERATPSTPIDSYTLHENRLRSIESLLIDIMKWEVQIMEGQNKMYRALARTDKKVNYLINHGIYIRMIMEKANLFEGVIGGVKPPPFPSETSSSDDIEQEIKKKGEGNSSREDKEKKTNPSTSSETEESNSGEDNDEDNESEANAENNGNKSEKADEEGDGSKAGSAD